MINNILKNRILYRILLGAAVLIIAYLAITEEAYPVVSDINDKFSHVLAFIVLAFLADFSFPEYHYNFRKIISLICYGVLLEIIQYFIPNRDFSFYDMLADLTGLMLYLPLLPVIKKIPVIGERWEPRI